MLVSPGWSAEKERSFDSRSARKEGAVSAVTAPPGLAAVSGARALAPAGTKAFSRHSEGRRAFLGPASDFEPLLPNIGVGAQGCGGSFEDDAAVAHHVAALGDFE